MVNQSSPAILDITASPFRTVQGTSILPVEASTSSYPDSINLKYLGGGPDGMTNNIATKKYAENYFRQNALVTETWIKNQANVLVGSLLTQNDADGILNASDGNGNRLYPRLSDLSNRLNEYANLSSLGFANGVAKADASGGLPALHVPSNIKLDNKAVYYNALTDANSTIFIVNTYVATSSSVTEFKAATVTVKDPGFSYYPMNFIYIQGKASGTSQSRLTGTGNMGLITVAAAPPPGQLPTTIYAQGTCGPHPYRNWYLALPFVNRWTASPPVRAVTGTTALRGDLTLNLYLTNYQGNGYEFGPGLAWSIILFPTNTSTVSA